MISMSKKKETPDCVVGPLIYYLSASRIMYTYLYERYIIIPLSVEEMNTNDKQGS